MGGVASMRQAGPGPAAAPRIETARLVLRAHVAADLDAVAALWGDAAVVRHIGGTPATRDEAWARMLRYAGLWTLCGYGYWAIAAKQDGRFLGDVGLGDFQRALAPLPYAPPEAGWVLAPAAQGRGVATEAVQAMLGWADATLAAARITCLIDPANAPSHRVAAKAGFRPQGETRLRDRPVLILARARYGAAGASP